MTEIPSYRMAHERGGLSYGGSRPISPTGEYRTLPQTISPAAEYSTTASRSYPSTTTPAVEYVSMAETVSPAAEYRSIRQLPERGNSFYADRYGDRYEQPNAYRSSSVEPIVYRSSSSEPIAYRSSSVEPMAYRSSSVEPMAYGSSSVEPMAYRSSSVEPMAYRSSSVEPMAYRSSSVDARQAYGDGYRDRVVYRSNSPDMRTNSFYGTSNLGGGASYASVPEYGSRALGSTSNIMYGSSVPADRYASNYYAAPRAYDLGDRFAAGSHSYAPPTSASLSYTPPSISNSYALAPNSSISYAPPPGSYTLPQAGSFVAEPFAAGAPYFEEPRLPQAGSFEAPLGGIGMRTPDYGFGMLPPPAPSSFAYGNYMPDSPLSMAPSLLEPRTNHYAPNAAARPPREQPSEKPSGIEAPADRIADRRKEKLEKLEADPCPPTQKPKKRRGYGCC